MSSNNSINPYQSKAGSIIAIIGSILLIIGGFSGFGMLSYLNSIITGAGETWTSLGVDPSLLYVRMGITLFLGIGGIIASILSFRYRLVGGVICIILGMITIIGWFIPIGFIDLSSISAGIATVTMNGAGLVIDPFLIIIGGILCIVMRTKLKTDEEVKAELVKRYGNYTDNL